MSKYDKYLKTYGSKLQLLGSDKEIEIRPLTTNDMKRLLVFENQDDPLIGEEILDEMLNNVILTEDFNVDDLYIQDRYYLFIKIREKTKGSKYSFDIKCPNNNNCKNVISKTVNLNDLEITNMNPLKNQSVEVLDNQLKLHMGHIKRGEQKEAYSLIDKKLTNTEKQVEMILSDLALSVKSITSPEGEDNPTIQEKIDLIGNLPQQEYDKIREWKDNNDFGINLKTEICCNVCEYKEEFPIPLNNFFK